MRVLVTVVVLLGACASGLTARDAVAEAFAGRAGCAVVLDIKSGRVLSSHRMDVCARTVTRPGSTLKSLTTAALLERGVLRADTPFACRRQVRLAGREMDCSHEQDATPLTAADAIAFSCNSFVTHFAAMMLSADLAQVLRSYGLGSPTGLVPSEATGEVAIAPTSERRQLQAIGESDVLVTPLAIANAYRKLAVNAAIVVREGLIRAVSQGTGQLAASKRIEIAGKTGTALTVDGGRRQAWFAGFAPARDPQIAFVVFVPQGSGARDAAPIAKLLVEAWAERR